MSKSRYSRRRRRRLKSGVVVALVCVVIAAAAAVLVKTGALKKIAQPTSEAQSTAVLSSAQSSTASASSSEASSLPEKQVKTTKKIPVLMYHSINYEKNNILRVPKEKFAAQMKWLYDNGYSTLSLDEVYDAVANDKEVPEKSVVLTFDDGYKDNYENAFPVLKKYNFKATVFMITDEIGDSKNGYLTAEQIKEMDSYGIRVESHTLDHPDLDSLSYEKQYKELAESKATLEKLLGRTVNFIAYPSGRYDSNTIKAAKKAGYKMCFKMKGGIGSIDDNEYEFPRFFVGEDLDDFISRVEGTADYS